MRSHAERALARSAKRLAASTRGILDSKHARTAPLEGSASSSAAHTDDAPQSLRGTTGGRSPELETRPDQRETERDQTKPDQTRSDQREREREGQTDRQRPDQTRERERDHNRPCIESEGDKERERERDRETERPDQTRPGQTRPDQTRPDQRERERPDQSTQATLPSSTLRTSFPLQREFNF